jgi:hypothetical protein
MARFQEQKSFNCYKVPCAETKAKSNIDTIKSRFLVKHGQNAKYEIYSVDRLYRTEDVNGFYLLYAHKAF